MFALRNAFIPRHGHRTFITIVNQAEVAYRQFLGMNRVRLEPGIRICLPYLHQIDRVDMRERCVLINNMNGYTSDNVPVAVSGSLFFRVTDAEKACFSVKNYIACVKDVGESTSRSVIGKFQYDKIISQRNEINIELVKTIENSIDQWGVKCTRFEITGFGPQNKEVAHHLEKQMEAERRRRENELNTQAKIRTAEGERDATKLEADAAFYQVKLEADSKAYALDKSAEALARQIETISNATGDSEKTLDFILEMERQKNLNAIATNNQSAVYFVDPRNMYPMQRHINVQHTQSNDKIETE
jgi:regulator of protease activity HflC (stomatin/prohibitin superfamily)